MNTTIVQTVHFTRRGRRKSLQVGSEQNQAAPGRIPRISQLMAIAIRFDQLIREGQVSNYAELARIGQVTRNRVTHIMNLLLLAPDIQEQLLFLPRVDRGKEPLYLKDLLPITRECRWSLQRQMWENRVRIESDHVEKK